MQKQSRRVSHHLQPQTYKHADSESPRLVFHPQREMRDNEDAKVDCEEEVPAIIRKIEELRLGETARLEGAFVLRNAKVAARVRIEAHFGAMKQRKPT